MTRARKEEAALIAKAEARMLKLEGLSGPHAEKREGVGKQLAERRAKRRAEKPDGPTLPR